MTDIAMVALVLLLMPFVVYTSVKLGTYAFFKGRQLWYQSQENKRNDKT